MQALISILSLASGFTLHMKTLRLFFYFGFELDELQDPPSATIKLMDKGTMSSFSCEVTFEIRRQAPLENRRV